MVSVKSIIQIASVVVFSVVGNNGFGQEDLFTNYKPLKAQGKIPEAFTKSTESKITDALGTERAKLTEKQKILFLDNVHYGIDQLLQSGLILYGDPATKYVEKVAANLLKNDSKLRKELQFYVIKSNVTNALSTDQGIIFVTLGLLSQLENEAQLAYVLSHEIAHFQEKHVEESYTEEIGSGEILTYDQRITKLSNHSKEKEFEADKLGIKLYHEAGYAESELLSAFDVMMYSYLPFDEEKLPLEYFNNEFLFIPESMFPEEINKILVEENYDDTKSSHPNIRKRKDAVRDALEDYSNWKKNIYLLQENEFKQIRALSRFESVRLDLLNSDYGDALYSLFLLEKQYPDNIYLSRCKAQAWLGLASHKIDGGYNETIRKASDVEGESHAMHYLLKKFSKEQLLTISMRMIEDVRKQFPDDKEIKAINNRMIQYLAGYSKFSIRDYSEQTFVMALEEFEKSKLALLNPVEDTVVVEIEEEKELSKYDKIKIKREGVTALSEDEEFDYSKFHLFALSDLVGDEEFKRKHRQFQDEIEEKKAEEDEWYAMSSAEKKKKLSEENAAGVKEVLLVEPAFFQYYYKMEDLKPSEEKEKLIIEMLKKQGEKFGIKMYDLTMQETEKQTTDKYNEQSILLDYLRQKRKNTENEIFPVDFSQLQTIRTNYGESKLMFVFGEYIRTKVTHRFSLNVVIIDLEKGVIERSKRYFSKQKLRAAILEGFMYKMVSDLSKPEKNIEIR